MTVLRKIILEELRKMRSHPTADEVCDAVRKRVPRISLGTVYRNLEILSQWGMAQRLDLAGTSRRFDGSIEEHYHVRCVDCGEVGDLPIEPLWNLEDSVRANTDFEIIGYGLNFLGRCPACRSRTPGPSAPPPKQEPEDLVNAKQGGYTIEGQPKGGTPGG